MIKPMRRKSGCKLLTITLSPNSNGTFAKPCPASNKFVRNRRFMLQAKRGLKLPYATRKV